MGSDGSGGQVLTPEWLYGRLGCRGGSKSQKTAAGLICNLRKQSLTALQLSFVEGRLNKLKEEKKSFGLMCQTPRKVYFFMTSGHLSGAYYVAQVTRAIVRIYTDLTGILLTH